MREVPGYCKLYTSKLEQILAYNLYMYLLQWVYVFYIAIDTLGMAGQR
jgi:hypothetical protein